MSPSERLAFAIVNIVDFSRPIQSVIPGAQGRLLAALARVDAELPVTTVAQLASVGRTRASGILSELAALGIVDRREVGRTVLVALDRSNAAGRLIHQLGGLRTGVLEELALLARALDPAPCSVVVFGSFARGEAGPDSDIDLLAVRPSPVDEERWAEGLAEFTRQVGMLTGNRPQVLELQLGALRRRALSGRAKVGGAFWSSVLHDGITVAGSDLRSLIGESNRTAR